MMVLLADAHALRYCNPGMRTFFERHGLDWSEFVTNGLPEEVLAVIDDEMVRAVIAEAHRRNKEETHGRQ
jgi:hypothetical protein